MGTRPSSVALHAPIAGVVVPRPPRRWDGVKSDDLFVLKGDLLALLEEIGAPALQVAQGQASSWWHPGRSARLQLGPKTVVAEFGELGLVQLCHPGVGKTSHDQVHLPHAAVPGPEFELAAAHWAP